VLECGEQFERCAHCAGAHLPEMKDSALGMQTYLGKEPFVFDDAIAVIIAGRRYTLAGGGHDAAYLADPRFKTLPPNTWVSDVIANNRKKMSLPTATQNNGEFTPFPGVTWVFPPIKTIPHETLVVG